MSSSAVISSANLFCPRSNHDESYLLHAPEERLPFNGKWQEGFIPTQHASSMESGTTVSPDPVCPRGFVGFSVFEAAAWWGYRAALRAWLKTAGPASQPRLVMVVMIDDPQNGKIYGGLVAAPVFEHVMSGALRLLDIPPDNLPLLETRSPSKGGPA